MTPRTSTQIRFVAALAISATLTVAGAAHAAPIDVAQIAFGRTGTATWQQISTTGPHDDIALTSQLADPGNASGLFFSSEGWDSENQSPGESNAHSLPTSPAGADYTTPANVTAGALRLEGGSTTFTLSSAQAFTVNLGIVISRLNGSNAATFWQSTYTVVKLDDTDGASLVLTTGGASQPTDSGWLANLSSEFDGSEHVLTIRMNQSGGNDSNSRSGINAMVVELVPEPASLALMGLGGLCLIGGRRGKR